MKSFVKFQEPPTLPFPPKLTQILKNSPPSEDVQLQHAWDPDRRSLNICVKDEDPFTAHRFPVAQSTDGICGKQAYSSGCHVWSVEWSESERGTHAMLGVATQRAKLHSAGYNGLLDFADQIWGWNMNWGEFSEKQILFSKKKISEKLELNHNKQSMRYPKNCKNWTPPGKIYCILDMNAGTLAFATESNFLGVAFEGLEGKSLYPVVGVVWGHAEITMKYMGGDQMEKSEDGECKLH